MYKIKVDKNLLKKLQLYWKEAKKLEEHFYKQICILEEKMTDDLKMNDTLEFFFVDGSMVGIGNYAKTMRLIQREELESGKLKKD